MNGNAQANFSNPISRKLKRVREVFYTAILFTISSALPACAQTPQFLPEVDANLKLNPDVRAYFQAKDDRDGGYPTQFTFGPSIQLYLKPLLRLKNVTAFDLDDSKSRALALEAGYRLITDPNTSVENRELVAGTFPLPLGAGVHLSDRNRADLDWKDGKFAWRYHNKLIFDRAFALHSYHFIPYVAAEPFYESQYSKWSTTDLYIGSLFPIGKRFQLDTYDEHENDTGKKPNKQQNYVGLILNMYFHLPGQ